MKTHGLNESDWLWILNRVQHGFSIEIEGKSVETSNPFYFVFAHVATPCADNAMNEVSHV